jgi:hypothetical protein
MSSALDGRNVVKLIAGSIKKKYMHVQVQIKQCCSICNLTLTFAIFMQPSRQIKHNSQIYF